MSATLQNSRPRNKGRQHNASGRMGYQNANSYRRETPEPEVPTGLYADPRSAVMMCSIIGSQTTVKTANGKFYKGRTTGFSDKGDIAMADARLENDDGSQGPNLSGIIIPKDNFVMCKTNSLDLKGICSSNSDFTDSGIVSRINGSSDGQFRDLQPWVPDDGADMTTSLSLDDNTSGWDSESMFQENFQKFNVQTSYNESMHEYTTRLPDSSSESYAAKERFAKEKAEEIERDETYQRRIAKELADNDEDSRFSFVHRDDNSPHRSHDKPGSNVYPSRQSFPPLRGERDRDDHLRNGNLHRGQARGSLQRQNSPYSSGGQSHLHSRQNNYQQGPPPTGPVNRSSGHVPSHVRHQQGPPPPPSSSQNHLHHHQQFPSQQQQQSQMLSQGPPRIPPHQSVVSPTQAPPGKLPHSVPSSSTPSSLSSPVQSQQLQTHKAAPTPTHGVNGVSGSQLRHGPVHMNGELGQQAKEQKGASNYVPDSGSAPSSSMPVNALQQHEAKRQASPSSSSSPASTAAMVSSGPPQTKSPSSGSTPPPSSGPAVLTTKAAPPPPTTSSNIHRGGRNNETNPEEARSKIADLQAFKEKFVLEPPKQEEITEHSSSQASPPSMVAPVVSQASGSSDAASTVVPQAALPAAAVAEQSSTAEASAGEKKEEATPVTKTSKLNPNAKEFKPKAPVETQSPSPQPRSSPQVQMVQYPTHSPIMMQLPTAGYIMHQNPQRKRATVSLQANVDHLTHQVTGQPLLATQPPMAPMMYIQGAPSASLPAGYPHILPNPQIMGRMPNSLAMAQGQPGIDQAGGQNQPQPMFVSAQQQPVPAHLPHPQPAHGGPMQQQGAQPAHVPNPAPSPVHHQQQQQPQHHQLGQAPPQSVTPQPAHYMNFAQHGMPRTSMAGGGGNQQNLAGHPAAVSISYMSAAPQYTSYQNANSGAQYSFAATPAQPQTSQNSSHNQGGPHPQYVMMPHTAPQHPPMQQHLGQANPAAGLQFHPQPNIMQGPPQMPPNHGHQPNQGAPHLLQHGMPAGLHQQVAASQPGMFMPMPSAQIFQHQQ